MAKIVLGRGQVGGGISGAGELPDQRDIYGGDSDIMSKPFIVEIEGDRILRKLDPKSKSKRTQDDKENIPSYDPKEYWPIRDNSTGKIKSYVYPDREVVNSYLYEDESRSANNRNNNVLVPLNVNITVDGISGIRIGDCFMVDSIPNRYREIGIFQIVDISEDVSTNGWTTRMEGQLRVGNI